MALADLTARIMAEVISELKVDGPIGMGELERSDDSGLPVLPIGVVVAYSQTGVPLFMRTIREVGRDDYRFLVDPFLSDYVEYIRVVRTDDDTVSGVVAEMFAEMFGDTFLIPPARKRGRKAAAAKEAELDDEGNPVGRRRGRPRRDASGGDELGVPKPAGRRGRPRKEEGGTGAAQ